MKLKLLTPTETLIDRDVTRVTAEALNGSFCLLPRHVDFVAPLAPGLFSYTDDGGGEETLALDTGVLVKCGEEVLVSTRNAVRSGNLNELDRAVHDVFMNLDERQKKARSALARLEASFVTRFLEMQETGA